jgi:hypothetical protein
MQRKSVTTIKFTLATVFAIASIGIVSVASAAVPVEASNTKTIDSGGSFLKNVGARCPSGKFPVSGGYKVEDGSIGAAFPQGEGVDLSGKVWSLGFFASEQVRVTAFAYCAPMGRDIKFRSDRRRLETGGDSASVTATCKRGERVFSGGYAFVSSGDAGGLISRSFRQGRSWTIQAINISGNPVTVLAFAHCRPASKVPSVTTVRERIPYEDEGLTTATAKCPPDRYALSGGYRDPQTDVPSVFTSSQRVGTRSWRVTEGGLNGRDDKLTVFAYCAKK